MKQSGDKVSAVAPTPGSQSVAQSEQHPGSRQQMTPDELRRGPVNQWDPKQLDEFLHAAADAWDETEGRLFDSHGMVMDLRKRLDAAEKEIADLGASRAASGPCDWDRMEAEYAEYEAAKAALAGKP